MITTVGIIGAGLAGLTTAKTLTGLGFEVTLFEKDVEVGGVWSASRRYPDVTTQNTGETYAFSDFPMPAHYPEWPKGEQVQRYLADYARHFGILERVRLGTEVVSARPHPDHTGWTVTYRERGSDTTAEEAFDQLIVCNGIFSTPKIPDYPGRAEFEAAGGLVCHTSELGDRDQVRGKHVVVVGYGKSSCDAAQALVGSADSMAVVARDLMWKIPKRIGNVVHFKHIMFTRLGEALFKYIEPKGVEKFLHGPGLPIRNAMMNSIANTVARQFHLSDLGLHPQRHLETIANSSISMVTDGFYESIRAGRITMHTDTEIARLSPGKAHLANGDVIAADIILCGTGWDQHIPFFDDAELKHIVDAEGNFRLYKSMVPVGVSRLLFNGYNSSYFSQLNAEIGALWLGDYLMGGITLPSPAQQNAYIDTRLAWMYERTNGKHSKGTNIIPFSVHHMDELLADAHLSLPRGRRLKQWFSYLKPADYRDRYPALLKRYHRA